MLFGSFTPSLLRNVKRSSMAAPLFRFGIVADVQYANKDNTGGEGRVQRYREAPAKLADAVASWKTDGRLSCVLNLGDTVDGSGSREATEADLETVAAHFDALSPLPVHHCMGNHCLAWLPRDLLLRRLGLPSSYYDVPLGEGWRLAVLDTTDMSLHGGYGEDSEQGKEAAAYLREHPVEDHPHMTPWNGGVGSRQLDWLRGVLATAGGRGERVVVATHHPCGGSRPSHRAWNFEQIAKEIEGSGVVALALAGHDHPGGYSCSEASGVHFLTLPAVLESPTGENAHGIVEVYGDRIEVLGSGTVPTLSLALPARRAQT